MRDPLYQQILTALENLPSDQGNLFEECMVDLLAEIYPGLAPVYGGSDAGMDGAIPDAEGEPFPLVCTIGKDVARNLAGSLDSHPKRFPKARKVVLATSRPITNPKRFELQELARKRDFTLAQIHEQRGVANLLYRAPDWRRVLLGLSGDLPALSVFPPGRRPLVELELQGRDRDLEWLKTGTGDRLVLGQPGSGKSYLLHNLALDGWGLFVATDDRERLFDGIRKQRPPRIIFDDAHASLPLLDALVQGRRELGDFEIIATSWEFQAADVKAALGNVPTSQVHKLELLTRSEILAIYHQLGVEGSNDELRWLVAQADNRPGLAVTLGQLLRQGAWQEVMRGEALLENVVACFQALVGEDVAGLLAAFGIGGDTGHEMVAVAEQLGLPVEIVRQRCAALAAGGVLREARNTALSVWPRQLRMALLRQVFFTGTGTSLPYRALLERAPDRSSAVDALVDADHIARVPANELRELVVQNGSRGAWLGMVAREEHVDWALEVYPGPIVDLAPQALGLRPHKVIPRLLAEAEGDTGPTRSRPHHPLRILEDWIEDLRDHERSIDRRRILASEASSFLESGGDRNVARGAMLLALSPKLRGTSPDALGHTVTVRYGLLPRELLDQIPAIWKSVEPSFQTLAPGTWSQLQKALWDWIYPESGAPGLDSSDRRREQMREIARTILLDLWRSGEHGPGLSAGIARLAARIDLRMPGREDGVFDVLFPDEAKTLEEMQEQGKALAKAVSELASDWSGRSPRDVARDLLFFEKEAAIIDQKWPRESPALCRSMAQIAELPELWAEAFLGEELPGDLLAPFLERTVSERRPRWAALLERALERPQTTWKAAQIALLAEKLPDGLSENLDREVSELLPLIETMCLRGEMPSGRQRELLEHSEWPVAMATAIGTWTADPRGKIPDNLESAWREAILRSKTRHYGSEAEATTPFEYWLGEILASDPDLAKSWLEIRLQDPPRWVDHERGPFVRASSSLTSEQSRQLLSSVPPSGVAATLIPRLVSKDPEAYRTLLERADLKAYHLKPLFGLPEEDWEPLASLALEAGASPEKVAMATLYYGSFTIAGNGIEHWQRRERAFQAIESTSENDGVVEAARLGARFARRKAKEAEAAWRARELGRE